MQSKNSPDTKHKPDLDSLIAEDRARSERRRLMLQELLQEAADKKGYLLVHSSAMGQTLTTTGSPKAVPSYAATHSLEWIGKNVLLGVQMPFMESTINKKTGRLEIDEESEDKVKQRAPDWTRQPALSAYLAQPGRKFGPIIAVVNPPWVDDPKHENWDSKHRALKSATEFTPLDLEGRIGLLKLDGALIYALDGQHRVIGIRGIQEVRNDGRLVLKSKSGEPTKTVLTRDEFLKRFRLSLEELQALLNETMIVEYIPAVIAGETRDEASRRIRNTFVSINSYAKRTDKGENILLDETDGYAIIARKAGIYHPLFNARGKNNRVNWKNTSIPKTRTSWYTTLQTIREMAENYLPAVDKERAREWGTFSRDQMPIRPTDDEIEGAKTQFFEFLDHVYQLPVFQQLERGEGDEDKRSAEVERWREFPSKKSPTNKGHLLLRPIGQAILASAVARLVMSREDGGRGMKLDAVFRKVKRLDEVGGFEAHRPQSVWYGVTYDPKKEKMIMGNQSWAQELLVYLIGGMDGPERQKLWENFLEARIVDKEAMTWMNLKGEVADFDIAQQELPPSI